MKAVLTFPNRQTAETFAIQWSRYSKTGHVIGSGLENVKVTIFDLTDEDKNWVDQYIFNYNNQ